MSVAGTINDLRKDPRSSASEAKHFVIASTSSVPLDLSAIPRRRTFIQSFAVQFSVFHRVDWTGTMSRT